MWGAARRDEQMTIIFGPKTFQWNKYGKEYTEPSIKMRNIQYGASRYILLVNSAKEAVSLRLSEFPSGLKITDMLSKKTLELGNSISNTIQSLGIRMYKITP